MCTHVHMCMFICVLVPMYEDVCMHVSDRAVEVRSRLHLLLSLFILR